MNRAEFLAALTTHFDLGELRAICHDLGIDHEFFEQKKPAFVRELIGYCQRCQTVPSLLAECQRQRPNINWVVDTSVTEREGGGQLIHNVPRLTPHFLGRDAQVAELVAALITGQSLALSAEGLPGVGKTTLAVALAHHPQVRAHFVDGVLWAGLGPNSDGVTALTDWANALGLDVTHLPEPAQRAHAIQTAIGPRKLLLVIDDAWDIETAQHLRCGGPGCAHLLTTRDAALGRKFAQGQVSKVQPLPTEAALALLQRLAPEACAADPAAVRHLAERVGGLPLALELLGGYLGEDEHSLFPELSAEAFAALAHPRTRLQQATQRLGTTTNKAETLQATIELSLRALPDDAVRRAWAALGAFAAKPASFSLAAAKAVCACDAALLAGFVRRNLLEKLDDQTVALHPILADVARAQAEADEEAVVRHRAFYLALANKDRRDWRTIGAAYLQIQHAWASVPKNQAALEWIWALSTYQGLRGLRQDEIDWIEQGLKITQANELRRYEAALLNNLGLVYNNLGQREKAIEYCNRTLPIHEEVGDRNGQATTLNNLGLIYNNLGQREKALEFYNRALPISEEVGDRSGQATTLNNIGAVYDSLGQYEKALEFYNRALPIQEEVSDRSGQATTLNNIGFVYDRLGQYDKALEYYNRALTIDEETGDRPVESVTRFNLALLFEEQGQLAEAIAQMERVVQIDEAIQSPDLESHRAALNRLRAKAQG